MLENNISMPVALLEPGTVVKYQTYVEAKAAVANLKCSSREVYWKIYTIDLRLPRNPNERYAEKGWKGWLEFLGKDLPIHHYAYQEAQSVVQKRGWATKDQYLLKRAVDPRLPANPSRTYSANWENWAEFLGTDPRGKKFYCYSTARKIAQQKGWRSAREYRLNCASDTRLPRQPQKVYRNKGWQGWNSFLLQKYYSFARAKQLVATLRIKSRNEYYLKRKKYPLLPVNPNTVYKKSGWTNWVDFLHGGYYSYRQARQAVKRLKISSGTEYRLKSKIDKRLPAHPLMFYRGRGWVSWYHFLNNNLTEYLSYRKAREIVIAAGCANKKDYKRLRSKNKSLPGRPDEFYSGYGWIDWYSFFGKTSKKILKLDEAVAFLKDKNLRCRNDYLDLLAIYEINFLSYDPERYYKKRGWKGWDYFLSKPCYYETYEEAKKAVQILNIPNKNVYRQGLYKQDEFLPFSPEKVYRNKGWVTWEKFLNYSPRVIYTFAEANLAVKKYGWETTRQYQFSYKIDSKFPLSPDKYYKGKGWKGWKDFLGAPYFSYQEAREYLCKRGVKIIRGYYWEIKKNPRLPARPQLIYAKDWTTWSDFFGRPSLA